MWWRVSWRRSAGLESPRPDLVAVALCMAELLDNPRATTSKPQAAAQLIRVMDGLHKSSPKRQNALAVVRSMTSGKKV